MDAHKIDNTFKEIVTNSSDFYSKKALESKAKVWDTIQSKKNSQRNLVLRILAAACITLLISSSYFLVSHFSKKNEVMHFASELKSLQNNFNALERINVKQKEQLSLLQNEVADTVFVESEKIRYKTIRELVTVVDTVFTERIVYVESEVGSDFLNKELLSSKFEEDSVMYVTMMQINNLEQEKKPESKPKFRINFGGNKGNDKSKSLALRSNF